MANNKKIIRQSNELSEACYRVTVAEKKLLILAFWKISKDEEKDEEKEIIINVHDYSDQWKCTVNQANVEIRSAIDQLYDRDIKFYSLNKRVRWLQEIPIKTGENEFIIKFGDFIYHHFKEKIKLGNFTKLYLNDLSKLKSVYAMRFYELFNRHTRGWFIINVQDLVLMMDIPESYCKSWDLIKRRIVDKAIKELTISGLFNCTYSIKKRGRRVHEIFFQFTKH